MKPIFELPQPASQIAEDYQRLIKRRGLPPEFPRAISEGREIFASKIAEMLILPLLGFQGS